MITTTTVDDGREQDLALSAITLDGGTEDDQNRTFQKRKRRNSNEQVTSADA